MKLDPNLVRTILLAIEAEDKELLANHEEQVLNYHYKKLIQGGFLESYEGPDQGGDYFFNTLELTYNGHTFLDNARDQGIWEKVQAKVKKYGSVALPIAQTLAAEYIKAELGIGGKS